MAPETEKPASAPSPFIPRVSDDDAVRLNTERLRALIDHLQSGILVEDEHRNIVHVNQKFLDFFNIPVPSEKMVGINCSQAAEQSKGLFSDPEEFVARITDLLARRDLAIGDEMTLVDGRYLERDYVPILLDDQFRGHYWHYRDVTERMKAQEEIRQLNRALEGRVQQLADANAELERMAKARAEFVSAIAHELSNAVSPVRAHLWVMRRRAAAGQGAADEAVMGIMGRNVDRLSLLVEDLLDASRLHAGRLSVHVADVDLNRIVEESVEAFAEQARERGVHLEVSLAPGLQMRADGRRVIQVMFNLLSNALKFTPRDGRIVVTTERSGDEARVSVSDTGSGLTPEGIAKLFQPFSQAHDPATGAKGTGLGLFICRDIVEQHGGEIACASDGPGHGTTFTFALPVAGPPAPRAGAR